MATGLVKLSAFEAYPARKKTMTKMANPTPDPTLTLHHRGSDPTLTLPLSGEGTVSSSPCQGGGWEGVLPSRQEVGREGVPVFNLPRLKSRRQELRKNQTLPEQILWQSIRNKQLGVKFRRQHGIGRYIADFYCTECSLVIEVDGDSHYTKDGMDYDRERDLFMQALGITVLRFSNDDIFNNIDGVLMCIAGIVANSSDPTLMRHSKGNDPTLALPLSGEGTISSSPCKGEGWEGGTTTHSEPCP
jgi:very-short-patch-repair endonuclease